MGEKWTLNLEFIFFHYLYYCENLSIQYSSFSGFVFSFIKVIVLCLFWLILSCSRDDSFLNVFKYCLFKLFNDLLIPHISNTYYILNAVTLTKEHFSSICMNAVEWVTFASLWSYQTLFTKYFDYYFVTNWHTLFILSPS